MNIIYKAIAMLLVANALQGLAIGQVDFLEVTTKSEMDSAKKMAAEQDMYLFVDVYATWCGPCKAMDREVYTDPAVATYLNARFVSVRMDGESDFGSKFAARYNLEGYPSMFIFDSQGEYIRTIVGFTRADMLVSNLGEMVSNYSTLAEYKKLYETRELEEDELAAYIDALRQMGTDEEAELLTQIYLSNINEEELSDEDISVVAYHLTLDNKFWIAFSADPERLRRVLDEDYMLAMEKIYNNSLVKAIDEDNIELISMMANDLAPLIEEKETSSWDLRTLPFIQYYYYTDQVEELVAYVDGRFASDRVDDHKWLYGAASQIVDMDQQYQTEELMSKGVEWFQTCINLEEQFDYYFYHGMALFFSMEKDEARSSFVKAKALALDEEQMSMVDQVLQFL